MTIIAALAFFTILIACLCGLAVLHAIVFGHQGSLIEATGVFQFVGFASFAVSVVLTLMFLIFK